MSHCLPRRFAPQSRIPALLLLTASLVSAAQVQPELLDATAFGLRGDGETDDGPAIARLLEAAEATSGPVLLRFPVKKTIRVKTASNR